MKTTPFLTAFICCSFVAKVAASANWHPTGDSISYVQDVDPAEAFVLPGDLPQTSMLEIGNQASSAVQRRNLLARFQTQETIAAQEATALQVQQRLLATLEQRHEVLQAQTEALEVTAAAFKPEQIVVDRGTLTPVAQEMNKESHTLSKHEPHRFTRVRTRIDVKETEDQFWDRSNKEFIERSIGIVSYVGTMMIAGFLYISVIGKSAPEKLPESATRTDDFQFHPFDCSELSRDGYICFCGLCCEWVRWADTASHPQVDFLAFWPGLFITSLLYATSSITYGLTMPLLLLIVTYCRQRIRHAYGLPHGTCDVIVWDCLIWCCCPCCAIVQEARQVEYVASSLEPVRDGDKPVNPYDTQPGTSSSLASA